MSHEHLPGFLSGIFPGSGTFLAAFLGSCFFGFGSTEIPKIQQKVAKICVNDWLIEQLYDTSSG